MLTEQEFTRLANEWEEGVCPQSFWNERKLHPVYEILLAYGQEAVPFILKRLQINPLQQGKPAIFWCELLLKITGEIPDYTPEGNDRIVRIDVRALVQAWLTWGQGQGHVVIKVGSHP